MRRFKHLRRKSRNATAEDAGPSRTETAFRRLSLDTLEPRLVMHHEAGPQSGTHWNEELEIFEFDSELFPWPAVTESEPNNTTAGANVFLKAGDTLSGSISNADDVDHYSAEFVQGEVLSILLQLNGSNEMPGQLHYAPLVEVVDSNGVVRARSSEGARIDYTITQSGTYYIRLSSQSSFGTYTGSYGMRASTAAFIGTTESEPNNTTGTADAISTSVQFRGTLSSESDVDYFSFTGTSGRSLLIRFADGGGTNPSVRLYNSTNTLIASDTTGRGLRVTLPAGGTYRIAISGDTDGGPFVGEYVAMIGQSGAAAVLENDASDSLTGAATWDFLTPQRASGTLSSLSDVDVFKVQFDSGSSYSFSIDNPSGGTARQGRILMLYNEYGQLVEYTRLGNLRTNAATGFGFRIERSGTYYLAISATESRGLGAYNLTGVRDTTFPTQRDTPLYFHDYTAQSTHLGYGPVTQTIPAQYIPLMVGLFEARYAQYHVAVTLTQPTVGTRYVSFGAGEFGSIGAYGYGGSFQLGTRSVSGQSLLDDAATNWTRLQSMSNPASVMNQETGHGSGMYAHSRNPLAFMAYDNQSTLSPIGQYYPFPWTDSRVPDVEIRNEREYLDWALSSGRNALEVEGNDTFATAQALAAFLAEMTADADPRNDRVNVAGRIGAAGDVDLYSFTVSSDESFTFDIEAAEFQSTLDASITIYDAAGHVIARNDDALDRDSGLSSVDPFLRHTFASAGTYYVGVTGARQTIGTYRLKLVADQAEETTGPRVLAAWPNGGSTQDSTRQLIFWFNDQIDPATLTSENVIVSGATSGVRSGTMHWDPQDATLVWYADAALPIDTYTVTFKSGATGLRDFRGNQLDGETDGALDWPSISGDGTAGGDFTTSFTIGANDTTAATVSSSSDRRHPYNRTVLTLTFNDELDVYQTYSGALQLRGAGADASYGTSDDYFVPIDVLYDKMNATSGRQLYLYSRGVLDVGNYRVEGTLRDAAGHNVVVSRTFAITASDNALQNGPSVVDLNVQPNSIVETSLDRVIVSFSGAVNVSTLTTQSFQLRYSQNSTFFDGDDQFVLDADGAIAWDPINFRATLQAAAALPAGYYLIELKGDAGGIADAQGRRLDGEFLDTNVPGNADYTMWKDSPSGDGLPGGDYRAAFIVRGQAPRVEGVYASSTAWASEFRDQLEDWGVGDAAFGFLVSSGSGQLNTLPWSNTNRLTVQFNTAVEIEQGDLALVGASGAELPAVTGFAWDAVRNAATWTFAAALPLNKYLLHLGDSITDALGTALDGEWSDALSVVSGDGLPGGDFNFRFNVLPGDLNNSQIVTSSDRTLVKLSTGNELGETAFGYFQDINGSGAVTSSDRTLVKLATGGDISELSEPIAPPGSTPSEGGPAPQYIVLGDAPAESTPTIIEPHYALVASDGGAANTFSLDGASAHSMPMTVASTADAPTTDVPTAGIVSNTANGLLALGQVVGSPTSGVVNWNSTVPSETTAMFGTAVTTNARTLNAPLTASPTTISAITLDSTPIVPLTGLEILAVDATSDPLAELVAGDVRRLRKTATVAALELYGDDGEAADVTDRA